MRSLLTAVAAATLLGAFGCRDRTPPPTPRLVGAASPAGVSEPREDAVGLGGSGEVVGAEATAAPAEPESKPNELSATPAADH